jgi:hypothetical protein
VHDARHTAAILLLAQGVDQRVVMEILGHSQISMTAKYAYVLPQLMIDAAEKIGQAKIGQALWGQPRSQPQLELQLAELAGSREKQRGRPNGTSFPELEPRTRGLSLLTGGGRAGVRIWRGAAGGRLAGVAAALWLVWLRGLRVWRQDGRGLSVTPASVWDESP